MHVLYHAIFFKFRESPEVTIYKLCMHGTQNIHINFETSTLANYCLTWKISQCNMCIWVYRYSYMLFVCFLCLTQSVLGSIPCTVLGDWTKYSSKGSSCGVSTFKLRSLSAKHTPSSRNGHYCPDILEEKEMIIKSLLNTWIWHSIEYYESMRAEL